MRQMLWCLPFLFFSTIGHARAFNGISHDTLKGLFTSAGGKETEGGETKRPTAPGKDPTEDLIEKAAVRVAARVTCKEALTTLSAAKKLGDDYMKAYQNVQKDPDTFYPYASTHGVFCSAASRTLIAIQILHGICAGGNGGELCERFEAEVPRTTPPDRIPTNTTRVGLEELERLCGQPSMVWHPGNFFLLIQRTRWAHDNFRNTCG